MEELNQPDEGLSQVVELASKIAYQCTPEWSYAGEVTVYESPQDLLEGRPRVWMIPAGVVELPPPPEEPGKIRYWVVGEDRWEYRDIPPPPEPEPEPEPTPEQILAINTATRRALLSTASLEIAPLEDAVELGIATPQEEAKLAEWKQYRILVTRVDLTIKNPNWPAQPTP